MHIKVKNIIYMLRLARLRLNRRVLNHWDLKIDKGVRIIVEDGGFCEFGHGNRLKEHTTLYIKKNARLVFGDHTSTGHHTEISVNNHVAIGNNVIMGAYTYITDADHAYRDNKLPIRKQPMLVGATKIGSNVWLGRGAFVLKNAVIGSNSVVGAKSLVLQSFPPNVVLGGVPAKVIKKIK